MAKFKAITIDDVIKAAEKNGFEWTKRKYYNRTGPIVEACILGQAALNLEVHPDSMLSFLVTSSPSVYKIWQYNDEEATSYEDALDNMRRILDPYRSISGSVQVSGVKREKVRKS